MEKQKRWQLILIVSVIALTLYNILPTIFYYSNSLREPVSREMAMDTAQQIVSRVNQLEDESVQWVQSYCDHLSLSPESIALAEEQPRLIQVTFNHPGESELFKRTLPQAGQRIPFLPAQLALSAVQPEDGKRVHVERRIGVKLHPEQTAELFSFTEKLDADGNPQPLYRTLVLDRLAQLALQVGGPSSQALLTERALSAPGQQGDAALFHLADEMAQFSETFGPNHPITQRYLQSFSRTEKSEWKAPADQLLSKFEATKTSVQNRLSTLSLEQEKKQAEGELLQSEQQQLLLSLERQQESLEKAIAIVKEQRVHLNESRSPFTLNALEKALQGDTLDLNEAHPFIRQLTIDWNTDTLILSLHEDVQAIREADKQQEIAQIRKEKLEQLLINEIALLSRLTEEEITPQQDLFVVSLAEVSGSKSLLTLNLNQLAKEQVQQLHQQISSSWHPSHPDLQRDVYPIMEKETHSQLGIAEKKLGLVTYAPASQAASWDRGFRSSSIYIVAKGLKAILDQASSYPDSDASLQLSKDLQQLQELLADRGFFGYPAAAYGFGREFEEDIIFEWNDYFGDLIKATRETFTIKGSHKHAVLEFSDVEQRLVTTNKIEEAIHEDLLKWREEYNGAQVSLRPSEKLLVPAPTKNVYVENLKLNARKYFRGDDRKILRWGLDLSGGKSVRIGLQNQGGQPVTEPEDLKQAVNELYTRINSMGVSERTIRIENAHILLDFPGVQGLSADELVKASAMYFHIVNEKFSSQNPALRGAVNTFLQDVWNEAVVTNRKDATSLNTIAWEHLGGDENQAEGFRPRSEAAKTLFEAGLRLASPEASLASNAFDDTFSSIALWRGEDHGDWQGQSHPLLITFRNYGLEGSSLENVQAGYDPSRGNILTFSVRGSYQGKNRSGSPRDDFHAWTSQFAKSQISGTVLESFSRGEGWRMAVILNGSVISAPTLSEALRDQAMISGSFSQREVSQLAADLKAGSLSFTPKVLSETNVSPDLGQEERFWGITASAVGLFAVMAAMMSYYRFSGLVASFAVLLNLLIMWGTLQNLDAALTLPGIAGIILTVGMAVDANVLVFERIREELLVSNRLSTAVAAGYRKAFSAIVDSNVTTIIAALILIQFDSGPVKGFAVTLIIGILSSMFTALFMTRYFFAGWVRNPKNTTLKMSQFLKRSNIDFLGKGKLVATCSLALIALGGSLIFSQWQSLLGMDFTGGYAITLQLEEQAEAQYRQRALEAFTASGAQVGDVEVRELNKPNQLRVQMGFSMDQEGHPFNGMAQRVEKADGELNFSKNPRLSWVVDSLQKAGLEIKTSQLEQIEGGWTLMSGQFSEVMRNNALLALGCALVSILIYLTFRFEFKFAISAIIALAHDVLVTLAALGVLYQIGVPVQINLEVIGAIMTIIGYSLNDTIIIFDRIREDVRLHKKKPLEEVVNQALNVTLSRTLITSGTTLLVLLSLVLLGGSAIFDLSLVMTIGVLFGTISSLFIASPVMLFFHYREEKQEQTSSSQTLLKKA